MAAPGSSRNPIMTLAGLILVVAFLYWARAVLVPLALATFFAFILAPPVSALQRRGPGRVASTLIVVLLAFGLLGSVGFLVGNQIAGLARRMPEYRDVIASKIQSVSDTKGTGIISTLRRTVTEVNERVEEVKRESEKSTGTTKAKQEPEKSTGTTDTEEKPRGAVTDKPIYVQQVTPGWNGIAEYAGPAAEGLASTVLVVVMVIFMLIQRENLRNRLVRLIGHGELILTTRAIDEGARRVSRFLLMQLCINAGFGITLALIIAVMSRFGQTPEDRDTLLRYAVLWGFVCGLMRFVPYIGIWLAASLLFAFTIATMHGWALPVVLFCAFLILELLCANAIEPLLFGHSTGSSPLALLLAAAFWAWLWGPVGLLLSTPLTVILVVAGKYVPQLHFLEVLLGDEPVLAKHLVLYQRLVAQDRDEASDLVDDYLKDHSPEDVYQELFLPAMIPARTDLERGELNGENARQMLQTLRELIDEIAPAPVTLPEEGPAAARMLGCPARDELDELALLMLRHMLQSQGRSLEIISSSALSAEVMERAANTCPAVVVVGSVAPGGLAQARYLCKRVKTQFSGIKVVVGRWGQLDNLDRDRDRLKAAGADVVGSSLAETRVEAVSLLQVAEASSTTKPQQERLELAVTH